MKNSPLIITNRLSRAKTKKTKIMKILTRNRPKPQIWQQRSRTWKNRKKRKSLNLSNCPTLKLFTQKLLKKNLNSTRNLQQIITIRDGSGCSSLGFVWRWNAITLISSENALHLQPHICPYLKRESSLYVKLYNILEALKIAL